jgi:hypothetical protein
MGVGASRCFSGAALVWKLENNGIQGYGVIPSQITQLVKLEPQIFIHQAWELFAGSDW